MLEAYFSDVLFSGKEHLGEFSVICKTTTQSNVNYSQASFPSQYSRIMNNNNNKGSE